MKRFFNGNIFVLFFLIISIIGFFLPWFYFEESVDYRTGLPWLNNPFLIGCYICSISFKILEMNIESLIPTLIIFVYEIYVFFTWHVLTITGKIDIKISFLTAHYGFYISLLSLFIAIIINLVIIIKKNKIKKKELPQ